LLLNQLLKQGATEGTLFYILYYGSQPKYKALAWKQLLKQGISNKGLLLIVLNLEPKYKALAWEQLLKQGPTNDDLYYIVYHNINEYKKRAKELLNTIR